MLDALVDSAPLEPGEARSYLARFLFRGDDAFKPVSELSGGERSRLELAVLGVSAANLLLLDEPTNHLDIPAREALEAFLREASATLLIVSHDRRLLESVCQRLWVVEAGRGGRTRLDRAVRWRLAGVARGGRRWLDRGRRAGAAGAAGSTAAGRREAGDGPPTVAPKPAPQPVAVAARAGRREPLSKDAYRRQRAVVDADLTRLGLRKSQLELALGRPDTQANFVELRRVASELADVDTALAHGGGRLAGPRGAGAAMTGPGRAASHGPHRPDRPDRLRQVHGRRPGWPRGARSSSTPTRSPARSPTSRPVRAAIVAAFGPAVAGPDGGLDRGALAATVFDDPAALARLEGLIHPHVRGPIEAAVAAAEAAWCAGRRHRGHQAGRGRPRRHV